jgi:hypothetical protein
MKLILKSETKYFRRVMSCSPCRITWHWDRFLAEYSGYSTSAISPILHVVLIYLPSTLYSLDTKSVANFAYNTDKKRVPCYTSEYRPTLFVAIIRVSQVTRSNYITINSTNTFFHFLTAQAFRPHKPILKHIYFDILQHCSPHKNVLNVLMLVFLITKYF